MKKIILILLCFVFVICFYNLSISAENGNEYLEFSYKGEEYNIDVQNLAKNDDVELNDINYPYCIGLDSGKDIHIYYFQDRPGVTFYEEENNYLFLTYTNIYEVIINSNGTITTKKYKSGKSIYAKYSDTIDNYGIMLSNFNIIEKVKGIVFNKNYGYTYNSSNESKDNINEVVQVASDIKAYDGASLTNDIKVTIKRGDVVLKVKSNVNIHNGITWDKIRLANGTELYVNSENLIKTDEYENMNFIYGDINYNVFFSPQNDSIELNDINYPYCIGLDSGKDIHIYYFKDRPGVTFYEEENKYLLLTYTNIYEVIINSNGTITTEKYKSGKYIYAKYSDTIDNYGIMLSNFNIIEKEKGIVFNKNYGYTYNSSNESEDNINEVVQVTSDIKAYDGASLTNDIKTTIKQGNVILKIKSNVNIHNGITWDKIRLANGAELYVNSENLIKTDEYENMNFIYGDTNYDVYFSIKEYNINLNEFENYFIFDTTSGINIYYYQDRPGVNYSKEEDYYLFISNNPLLKISIKKDGNVYLNYYKKRNEEYIRAISSKNNYGFVLSSFDIFLEGILKFPKIVRKLIGKSCNELVYVTKNNLKVMENMDKDGKVLSILNLNDVATRILLRSGVTEGIYWDKIKLENGTTGYVDTRGISRITYNNLTHTQVKGTYNGETSLYSSDISKAEMRTDPIEETKMILSESEAGKNLYDESMLVSVFNDMELLTVKEILLAISTSCINKGDIKDAGENLLYYLSKGKDGNIEGLNSYYLETPPYTKGHKMRNFRGKEFINNSNDARNRFYTEIGKSINAAEKFLMNGKESVEFMSEEEQLIDSVSDSDNWLLALGGYRISTDSKVKRTEEDIYEMDLEYYIEDYYDWREDDEKFTLIGFIEHAQVEGVQDALFAAASNPLWQMNIRGMARNYTNYDSISVKVIWKKGQNINSGALVYYK